MDPFPDGDATPSPAAPPATAKPGEVLLTLTSRPPGANIRLDGADRGHTPVNLSVAPGGHEVSLAMERYVTYTATITAPSLVDAQLKRPKATLLVTSTPSAAEVIVNGVKHGKTPVSVPVQQYEGANVEVNGAGGRSWKRRVYIKLPTQGVEAKLGPAPRASPPPLRGGVDTMGVRGTGIR
jgi:hypothetical protein